MKAIDRRLRRLQDRFAPEENEEVGRLVGLLRERRRRRAEASGEPFEVRPCAALTDDQNRPLSIADILRSGRLSLAYGVRHDVVKPTAHRSLDPTATR
jgi:hypothetical protein